MCHFPKVFHSLQSGCSCFVNGKAWYCQLPGILLRESIQNKTLALRNTRKGNRQMVLVSVLHRIYSPLSGCEKDFTFFLSHCPLTV